MKIGEGFYIQLFKLNLLLKKYEINKLLFIVKPVVPSFILVVHKVKNSKQKNFIDKINNTDASQPFSLLSLHILLRLHAWFQNHIKHLLDFPETLL